MSGEMPEIPQGWQYGVVLERRHRDGSRSYTVWGCGQGEDGKRRQTRRAAYSNVDCLCLIGPRIERSPDASTVTESLESEAA